MFEPAVYEGCRYVIGFQRRRKCPPALFMFIACDERHCHTYDGCKRPEFVVFHHTHPILSYVTWLVFANHVTKSKNHPGDFLLLLYIFKNLLSMELSTKTLEPTERFAFIFMRCLYYPKVISKIIITVNPRANISTPTLECSPSDISGISSSTTT